MANIQAAGQSAEPETGGRPLAVNGDRGAGGSPMGRVYRETTPAMVARVTAALDDRIGRALALLRICCARAGFRGWSTAWRPVDLGWS